MSGVRETALRACVEALARELAEIKWWREQLPEVRQRAGGGAEEARKAYVEAHWLNQVPLCYRWVVRR